MTIFAIILAVIHWLLRVWTTVIVVWFRLLAVVRLPAWSRVTVDSVRRKLATVDRIPIHVGLVFVEDDISLTDVAKLVVWSMVAGIAYITIYDHRGANPNPGSCRTVTVATLRPAAVSRACKYVGSKAPSSTNVLYEVSPS